jgi:arabinan endo-1,5-alpha-L-arabinosidase
MSTRATLSLAAGALALAALLAAAPAPPPRDTPGAPGPQTAPATSAATTPAGRGRGRGGPPLPQTAGEPRVHDPVIIREKDTYHVYYTGGGIASWTSKDLVRWDRGPTVFQPVPAWVATDIPQARGLWAPDISYFNGKYHLYYAASTFGRNRSAIGLATNVTLDPASKDYKWEDQGKVVESQTTDRYNAIDPAIVVDDKGVPWMSFGSFWGGIKLRKLDADGKADPTDTTLYSLAYRPEGNHALEAPFIIRHGGFYYLFVSFDVCCRGLDSTYRIMVGRSEKVTGPYVDKAGKQLMEGGGTELLAGDGKRIIGPGHCGLVEDKPAGDTTTADARWLLVHHFYDGNTPRGDAKLQVRPVTWADGWPAIGAAINKEP